jgi:predicted nucleotidyltransferase
MRNEMLFDVSACRATLQARLAQQYAAREKRRQAARAAARAAANRVLPHFPAVQRAYLFGSVLRPGALRLTSDVDIAIEGQLDAETYFSVWRELERSAPGWEIKVLELGPDVRFAACVRQEGEVIYERSDSDTESLALGC